MRVHCPVAFCYVTPPYISLSITPTTPGCCALSTVRDLITSTHILDIIMTTTPNTIFDARHLQALAREHRQTYATNHPFPHIVIDNFLPEDVAERILSIFPSPKGSKWEEYDRKHEVKLQLSDDQRMDPYLREVLYQFNSSVVVNFLEELTGIDGLIPDPHFEGGGLHQIEPGGYLDVHVDFNFHHRLKLDRRLNLILYLNPDWKDEYNGHLELWNTDMTECVQRIAPVFNRCVVFSTTDFSYHGHPDVLRSPDGVTRKSLALYYYSNGRPAEERSDAHSTVFQTRPGENSTAKVSGSRRMKRTLKRFIPPVVIDAVAAIRRKK